ncbi:MAG: AsmA family protein [Myxococcota bacterium]|nr:AsmA family protein [Myxococcota bacterium]
MHDADRPPRRGLIRAGRILAALLVLGLVLLLAGVLYLHSGDAAERGRVLLEQAGSQQLGEELSIQQLEIVRLFPPSVSLSGVSVHSSSDGKPLATVEGLGLGLARLPRPWTKRIEIEAISIDRPSVRIAMVDGQVRDFPTLVALLQRPRTQRPIWTVQLGSLEVVDARVRLSMSPQDLAVSVADLDLAWRLDQAGNGSGNLGVGSIDLSLGELREKGRLESTNFQIESRVVSLESSTVDLVAGALTIEGQVGLPDPPGAPQARPLTYSLTSRGFIDLPRLEDALDTLPAMEGKLDLSLGLTDTGDGPALSFNIQGHDVVVHLTKPKPKVFKVENPSLIGHVDEGRLLIEEESTRLWGGGRVKPSGWLDLKGDFPFEVTLGLQDMRLEQVLDSATVPGS